MFECYKYKLTDKYGVVMYKTLFKNETFMYTSKGFKIEVVK